MDDSDYEDYGEDDYDDDIPYSDKESEKESDEDEVDEEDEEDSTVADNTEIFDPNLYVIPGDFINVINRYRNIISKYYPDWIKSEEGFITRYDDGNGGVIVLPLASVSSKTVEKLGDYNIRERKIVIIHYDLNSAIVSGKKKIDTPSKKKKKDFSQMHTPSVRKVIKMMDVKKDKIIFIISAHMDLSSDITEAKYMVHFEVLDKEDTIDVLLNKNPDFFAIGSDLGFSDEYIILPNKVPIKDRYKEELMKLTDKEIRSIMLRHSPIPSRHPETRIYRLLLIEPGSVIYTDFPEIEGTYDKMDGPLVIRYDVRL